MQAGTPFISSFPCDSAPGFAPGSEIENGVVPVGARSEPASPSGSLRGYYSLRGTLRTGRVVRSKTSPSAVMAS